MGLRRLQVIVLGFACALCLSALAEDRLAPAQRARADPGVFGGNEGRPLDDGQLANLRGGLPAPMGLQQPGVVLWDEPRKGLLPQRTGGEPPHDANIDTGATIHR